MIERKTIKLHQSIGITRIENEPYVALFDKPGTGKSLQVIRGLSEVPVVVLVCPAQVKINWTDKEWGELAKWGSNISVNDIGGRDSKLRVGYWERLWYVVTYEWLRANLEKFYKSLGDRPFALVLDESSFIKNYKSKQWIACYGLRYGKIKKKVGRSTKWLQVRPPAERCILMNGTPVSNNLADLWAQFQVLDKDILDMTFWVFRATHCVMGGFLGKQIVGHRNEGKLMEKLSPYILQRGIEILNLPEQTSKVVEIPLTDSTWKLYKQMRDELIVYLEDEVTTAEQAVVKVLRLSQITSGILGGFEGETKTISKEKTNWLLEWLNEINEPVIVWSWWRADIENLWNAITALKTWSVYRLVGGESKEGIHQFHPANSSSNRILLLAQPAAGGMGLNLAKASKQVYLSKNFSWLIREQSQARVYRTGQENSVQTLDVLATGPKGQKTIDYQVHKAVVKKEKLGEWVKEEWIKILREE